MSLALNWHLSSPFFTAAIRLAVPVLLATLGEIVTERSGILNLGLDGVMVVGGVAGFLVAYFTQTPVGGRVLLGLLAGAGGHADGAHRFGVCRDLTSRPGDHRRDVGCVWHGMANYIYRQQFSSALPRTAGLPPFEVPLLSRIPVIGDILFKHDATVYMTVILVVLVWYWNTPPGAWSIRAAGENPLRGDVRQVAAVRYAATLIGTGLAGLGVARCSPTCSCACSVRASWAAAGGSRWRW